MKNKKGFTLIELMIVVAIIGILAALAIPDFMKMLAKSKQSEAKTNLGAIFTGQVAYHGEKNTYGSTFNMVAWAPEGQNLYNYYMEAQSIATKKGDPNDACNADAGSGATQASFTAVANGNVDNDDTCDIWYVNDKKDLKNPTNDVNVG